MRQMILWSLAKEELCDFVGELCGEKKERKIRTDKGIGQTPHFDFATEKTGIIPRPVRLMELLGRSTRGALCRLPFDFRRLINLSSLVTASLFSAAALGPSSNGCA